MTKKTRIMTEHERSLVRGDGRKVAGVLVRNEADVDREARKGTPQRMSPLERATEAMRRNPNIQNPNCCGSHCRDIVGEVRVYPLGGGGNLILCHACWAHENRYRYERGRETGRPADWPQLSWETAYVYPDAP